MIEREWMSTSLESTKRGDSDRELLTSRLCEWGWRGTVLCIYFIYPFKSWQTVRMLVLRSQVSKQSNITGSQKGLKICTAQSKLRRTFNINVNPNCDIAVKQNREPYLQQTRPALTQSPAGSDDSASAVGPNSTQRNNTLDQLQIWKSTYNERHVQAIYEHTKR